MSNVSVSGWALVAVAMFWAVLVGFLCIALLSLFRVLTATRDLLEDFRRQTTPMLHELNVTVQQLNRELVEVEEILGNVRGTTGAVESIAKSVQAVVTHPAIRAVAVAAGAATTVRRLREKR